MEDFSVGSSSKMQKLQSFTVPKPQSNSDLPNFGASHMGTGVNPISPNWNHDMNNRRHGIPPSHPNIAGSRLNSQQLGSQNLKQGPGHSRSLSQPAFFNLDCLPPLSPSPIDVSMEDRVVNSNGNGKPIPSPGLGSHGNGIRVSDRSLPPRRGHRRSSSDVPLGFSAMIQSSAQLMPIGTRGASDRSGPGGNSNVDGSGERKSEGDFTDDLFNTYMNLDNFDTLYSSGTEDKDRDSRSGAKTGGESSENEVESSVKGYQVGSKRRAPGEIARTTRHHRSVSMDSYIGSLNFNEESLKLPTQDQNQGGRVSPGELMDVNWTKSKLLGSDGFTPAEMKKIMENERLAELFPVDPRRVKRILANRESAARSKERKVLYISELEQKVQTLQTETTTLSTQLTILQRDYTGLTTENKELKFRIQAMEQQARLTDALNEALVAEFQRLKLAAAERSGEAQLSSRLLQQLYLNNQMFQFQTQQSNAYGQPAQNNQKQKEESPANESES